MCVLHKFVTIVCDSIHFTWFGLQWTLMGGSIQNIGIGTDIGDIDHIGSKAQA